MKKINYVENPSTTIVGRDGPGFYFSSLGVQSSGGGGGALGTLWSEMTTTPWSDMETGGSDDRTWAEMES